MDILRLTDTFDTYKWVLGGLAVGGGAIARLFGVAHQNLWENADLLSDYLENKEYERQRKVAFNLLSNPSTVQHFKDSPLSQIKLIEHWISASIQHSSKFSRIAIQNMSKCLQEYTKHYSFSHAPDHAFNIVGIIHAFGSKIDDTARDTIFNNLFSSLEKNKLINAKTVAVADWMVRLYPGLVTASEMNNYRSYIIDALTPQKDLYGDFFESFDEEIESDFDYSPALAALDILFRPYNLDVRYQTTTSLSLKQGGYSEEQRNLIMRQARDTAKAIQNSIDEGKGSYGFYSKPSEVTAFIESLALESKKSKPFSNQTHTHGNAFCPLR